VNSASNAPPAADGSGRVVSGPAQPTNTQARSYRRTNLLSLLDKSERRAFLQERLDNAALWRRLVATKHGLLGPVERNVILGSEEPGEVDYQEIATTTGISLEEVKRREELARREAVADLREKILQQAETATPDETLPVASPLPTEPNLEAELARHEAMMDAQKQEIERLRGELDAAEQRGRTDASMDAAAERGAALRQDAEQPKEPPTQPQAPSPAPAAQPVCGKPPKTLMQQHGKTLASGITGAGALAVLGWALGWFDPATVAEPVKPDPVTPVVTTDQGTLDMLHQSGLAAPRTPLGQSVLEAFQADPSLREEVMRRVEETLLERKKAAGGQDGTGPE